MLLASEWIDAAQAVEVGLALRICPEGTVLDETMALARRIASFPPHATRQIKRLMMAAAARPSRRPGPGRRRPSPHLFADAAHNPGSQLTAGLDR